MCGISIAGIDEGLGQVDPKRAWSIALAGCMVAIGVAFYMTYGLAIAEYCAGQVLSPSQQELFREYGPVILLPATQSRYERCQANVRQLAWDSGHLQPALLEFAVYSILIALGSLALGLALSAGSRNPREEGR